MKVWYWKAHNQEFLIWEDEDWIASEGDLESCLYRRTDGHVGRCHVPNDSWCEAEDDFLQTNSSPLPCNLCAECDELFPFGIDCYLCLKCR